jgi:hypothetical protein
VDKLNKKQEREQMKIVAIACKQNTPLPGSISGGNLIYRTTEALHIDPHPQGVVMWQSQAPARKKLVPFTSLLWLEYDEEKPAAVQPQKLNLKA